MFGFSYAKQTIYLRWPASREIYVNWSDVLQAAGYIVSIRASQLGVEAQSRELARVTDSMPSKNALTISKCRALNCCTFLLTGSHLRFPVARQFLAMGFGFADSVVSDVASAMFRIAFSDELIDVISRHCFAFVPDNVNKERADDIERILVRHPSLLLPNKTNSLSHLKGHFGGSDRFGWYVAVSQMRDSWRIWKTTGEYAALVEEITRIGGKEIDIVSS